jgi:hypothetical protein
MAEQTLFGSYNPQLIQQAIEAERERGLLEQAKLTPQQIINLGAARSGQQMGQALGGVVNTLFGLPSVQDPRLQQAQLGQQAYQEALDASGNDASSPDFFKKLSSSAARLGVTTLAQQAAQQASKLESEQMLGFQRQAAGTASLAQATREKQASTLDQARQVVLQLASRTDLKPEEQRILANAREVLKLSTPGGTTINMTQESKFAGQRGELQAKALDAAAVSAASASSSLSTLNDLENLAKDNKLYTGPLAMTALGASNFLNSVGLLSAADARNLASAERYDKGAKDLVMQELGGKLGAQISDADRKFIEARIPQLTNSPTARLEIIQKLKDIQNGKINVYKRMNEYANKNNNLNDFDFSQSYIPSSIIAPQGAGTRENPIKLQ